jgi:hypothetical protein
VHAPHDRADVPGVEKALLDALQAFRVVNRRRVPNPGGVGCYANDKQVRAFTAEDGGVDAARRGRGARVAVGARRGLSYLTWSFPHV